MICRPPASMTNRPASHVFILPGLGVNALKKLIVSALVFFLIGVKWGATLSLSGGWLGRVGVGDVGPPCHPMQIFQLQ